MIRDDYFRKFQQVGWKFKGVEIVVSNVRANVSRIWSDLPAMLRNPNGQPVVKKLIDPLYKDIIKSCAEISKLPVKYNRLMKSIIKRLQSIGAFINNPFVSDKVAEKVAEAEVINKTIDEIFENVKNKLDIKPTDIDITTPNVIEIYIISEAKIDVTISFLESCREYLDNIIDRQKASGSKVEIEFLSEILSTMNDASNAIQSFIEKITELKEFFKKQTGVVIETLNDLMLDIKIEDSRKEEIINQVKACELYGSLSTVHRIIKPNAAFLRLMDNRKGDSKGTNNSIEHSNESEENKVVLNAK